MSTSFATMIRVLGFGSRSLVISRRATDENHGGRQKSPRWIFLYMETRLSSWTAARSPLAGSLVANRNPSSLLLLTLLLCDRRCPLPQGQLRHWIHASRSGEPCPRVPHRPYCRPWRQKLPPVNHCVLMGGIDASIAQKGRIRPDLRCFLHLPDRFPLHARHRPRSTSHHCRFGRHCSHACAAAHAPPLPSCDFLAGEKDRRAVPSRSPPSCTCSPPPTTCGNTSVRRARPSDHRNRPLDAGISASSLESAAKLEIVGRQAGGRKEPPKKIFFFALSLDLKNRQKL
ncbi:hypothetical protein COCNU_12G002170 [Cocos nucifera]|uniref:Uncharacterized protein n=1 Tax=Cocos nucifera TaxID=13894 RepID=A0A8K0ISL5_COCNU|nr:hypothetical protein COCNU_12G002170 [Cocos nucifera]